MFRTVLTWKNDCLEVTVCMKNKQRLNIFAQLCWWLWSRWLTNTPCVLKADSLHLHLLHVCIPAEQHAAAVERRSCGGRDGAESSRCLCQQWQTGTVNASPFSLQITHRVVLPSVGLSISFGKTQKSKKLLRCFGPLSDRLVLVVNDSGWVIQSNALQLTDVKGFLTGRELGWVGLAQSIINIIWKTSTVVMVISKCYMPANIII